MKKESNCNAAATGSFSHFLLSIKWSAAAAAFTFFSAEIKASPFFNPQLFAPFFSITSNGPVAVTLWLNHQAS